MAGSNKYYSSFLRGKEAVSAQLRNQVSKVEQQYPEYSLDEGLFQSYKSGSLSFEDVIKAETNRYNQYNKTQLAIAAQNEKDRLAAEEAARLAAEEAARQAALQAQHDLAYGGASDVLGAGAPKVASRRYTKSVGKDIITPTTENQASVLLKILLGK